MIKVYYTKLIKESGPYRIKDFNGEILKIVAFTEDVYSNVTLKLSSSDGEVLSDENLYSEKSIFYPKNTIHLTQEQIHIENYIVLGELYLTISGLGEGESIERIAIYYK